ncbi:hypothetical protein TWF506_010448 [Arthrobotrys conoides]|uniref:Chromosome condensation protein n=1 Tax=Arthrobotrys conoides TaxID=74498 RepID=A0AAN8NF12_9PEZI
MASTETQAPDLKPSASAIASNPRISTQEPQKIPSQGSRVSHQYSGLAEVDAPPPVQDDTEDNLPHRRSFLEDERVEEQIEARAQAPTPLTRKKQIEFLTTVCWLIFFSIWGALARIGLSALTTYPGSPVSGVIWANFAGCFVMGFMAEEIHFFAGPPSLNGHMIGNEGGLKGTVDENHWSIDKKAIPLYIGITTGFCGSLTSFSTWMRDSFWAMSNTHLTHPRYPGYNVEALLAQIIATVALSVGGLKSGAHFALFLRPFIPTMPTGFRPHLDIIGMVLGPAFWIGVVMMAIFIPKWRGIVLFSGVFAPLGTLLRFLASKRLNPLLPSFPLGTFSVNVSGSMIDAVFILLQSYNGVNFVGCELLQGLEDGLCGCLTTVSTWVVEITTLRRGHAYRYGVASVLCGFASFVAILGTYTWDHGLDPRKC